MRHISVSREHYRTVRFKVGGPGINKTGYQKRVRRAILSSGLPSGIEKIGAPATDSITLYLCTKCSRTKTQIFRAPIRANRAGQDGANLLPVLSGGVYLNRALNPLWTTTEYNLHGRKHHAPKRRGYSLRGATTPEWSSTG